MKKSNFLFGRLPFHKMGFLSILLTFLFFAGSQIDVKAQTSSTLPNAQNSNLNRTLYQAPSGNFVPVAIAKDRLLNALTTLKSQLAQYPEGTAPYEAAFLRYTYYNEILTNLNNGRGVAESIAVSVGRITGTLNNAATPEQALVEKNAAINLLK